MRTRGAVGLATILVVSVLDLTSCSHLASRGNRYCLQAGALGAAAGAAGGAAIGRVIAGRHDNTTAMAIGAGIGALVGGLASCRYGVWVANQRQDYENEQARLTGELDNSRRTNESLRELNQQLANDLSARERELDYLQAASASTRVQADRKQQLAEELDQAYEAANQQLAAAENELQHHRQTLAVLQAQWQQVNEQELAKYRQQIAELEEEVALLERTTGGYKTASSILAGL